MNFSIDEIHQIIGEKQLQLEGIAKINESLRRELNRAIGDLKRLVDEEISPNQVEVNETTWSVEEKPSGD